MKQSTIETKFSDKYMLRFILIKKRNSSSYLKMLIL